VVEGRFDIRNLTRSAPTTSTLLDEVPAHSFLCLPAETTMLSHTVVSPLGSDSRFPSCCCSLSLTRPKRS
jgi:hypothetical protein